MKKLLMICVCALLFGFSVFSPQASAASIKLTMKQTKYSLEVGKSVKVGLSVSGTKLSKVKWKSSSSAIVMVNQSGTVKGIKEGSAKVTAYLPNTKYSAVTTITVSKKALTTQEVFQKVNPSIVYIELYDAKDKLLKTGSGVITKSDGVVVTNHHVITNIVEPSYVVIVLSDGRKFKTNQVFGFDADRDLAVLKINGVSNLKAVTLGDSSTLKTGEKSFALGSPLGISNTITEGIISNKSVKLDGDSTPYIQSTAPISSGNSGGALVNKFGEVIGINVATLIEGQNMNLAIPINYYKKIKLTSPNTLLTVNRLYYVPLSGEGTIEEEEPNDLPKDSDILEYKKNHIKATISNNDDFDYYAFLLTEESTVKIESYALDANLQGEYSFEIYDIDGETVDWGEEERDATGKIVSKSETKLPPGIYIIEFATYLDTTQVFSNSAYNTTVEVITQ